MSFDTSSLPSKGFVRRPDGSFYKPGRGTYPDPLKALPSEVLACRKSYPIGQGDKKFVIHTLPVPAPRMTRRDQWLNPRRPCVQRYFDYRDALLNVTGSGLAVPIHMDFWFWIPMPVSWADVKKDKMNRTPHRQRGDVDNYAKAVMDSLFDEDGGVSDIAAHKRWCRSGQERVELELVY